VLLKLLEQHSLSIRLATSNDGQAMIKIVDIALREYGLAGEPNGTDKCLQDIDNNYLNNGGEFYVIENLDKSILGGYGLFKLDREVCELRKMYFTKEIRGRGIGKAILDHVVQRALNLGFTSIELETASPLVEARHLYRSFGFKPFKKPHLPSRCDEAWRLDIKL
jgi:putative acetyltransferase